MVCQTDLTLVSSDTLAQTFRSVVYVSGGPGSVLTGTQASFGKSGPASTNARALCESALQADKSSGSSGAGPRSSSKDRTLTPGAGSSFSFEPQAPTYGVRSGTSASGHMAPRWRERGGVLPSLEKRWHLTPPPIPTAPPRRKVVVIDVPRKVIIR